MSELKHISKYIQLSKGNWDNKVKHQLPIAVVDQLALELISEYHNDPKWKPWYCDVVYKLGVAKVEELRARAREGKDPARLFSKLAHESMYRHQSRLESEL